jgi:hypothetical protein
MCHDDIIRRIERFRFPRAPIAAEWRNKGYTLFHAGTGRPIARLRPYDAARLAAPYRRDDLMEVRYWSLRRQRWAAVGPFGSTVVPFGEALQIIAAEPIFWVGI